MEEEKEELVQKHGEREDESRHFFEIHLLKKKPGKIKKISWMFFTKKI